MSSKLQIHLLEAALLALLPGRLQASYGKRVDVDTFSDDDFTDDGQLILRPPAVRFEFDRANYGPARDTQRTTMNAELDVTFFCFDESLKSKEDKRTKTLQLVACVQDELAGARLQLTPGVYTEPTLLKTVGKAVTREGPLDQVYAVTFGFTGIAQFSGVNANFGVRG
jgi:hypothetical protein